MMQTTKETKTLGRSVARWALVGVLVLASAAWAERGDDAERKSKNGHAEGSIDGVSVVVDYGRPEMRGREIFGGLVPYGQVWRTGADEATTVTLGSDALVGSEPVAAGTYSLFTIPGESEWTVILNRVADQWGAFEYDQAQDAVRATVPSQTVESTEALTVEIGESGITLRWAETGIEIPVAADT